MPEITVSKWGNGQGIHIPKKITEEANIRLGDKFLILFTGDSIILKPVKKKYPSISQRFDHYNGSLKLTEEWNSKPTGKEIW